MPSRVSRRFSSLLWLPLQRAGWRLGLLPALTLWTSSESNSCSPFRRTVHPHISCPVGGKLPPNRKLNLFSITARKSCRHPSRIVAGVRQTIKVKSTGSLSQFSARRGLREIFCWRWGRRLTTEAARFSRGVELHDHIEKSRGVITYHSDSAKIIGALY
jgi:hypothetical protein